MIALRGTIIAARIVASAPLFIAGGVCRELGLAVAGSDARLSWRYLLGAS